MARAFAILLLLVALAAWYFQRSYRATPEKAKEKLAAAWTKKPPQLPTPIQVERFDVGGDFAVTVVLATGSLPGLQPDEEPALQALGDWVRNTISKQVPVRFMRGNEQVLLNKP